MQTLTSGGTPLSGKNKMQVQAKSEAVVRRSGFINSVRASLELGHRGLLCAVMNSPRVILDQEKRIVYKDALPIGMNSRLLKE